MERQAIRQMQITNHGSHVKHVRVQGAHSEEGEPQVNEKSMSSLETTYQEISRPRTVAEPTLA